MSDHVVTKPLRDVFPSPENDKLYRPVSYDDPEIVSLAKSIETHGVREPLVVTADGFLLSGHRRRAAAELAGLREVPVRVEPIRRSDDPDRFLTLLREYNRQRVKGFDEKVREAVIDADPEECRWELIQHRRSKAKTGHDRFLIPAVKKRSAITKAKRPMVTAIKQIVEDLEDFWPLTDRQIHYKLLNDPPLVHASKPDSTFCNDKHSWKALTELLTRMRLVPEGHWAHIPMESIGDETRPIVDWTVHRDVTAFLRDQLTDFLKGYARDLVSSQPHHVEVVVEKNTVAGIIKPICADYTIPMTSGRGYSSLPPRHKMAQRFARSGKDRMVVVFVSDFDPEGEDLCRSFARSMRDDFGVSNVDGIKAALTDKQVRDFGLPPKMKVKQKSSRAAGFIEKHGTNVWELEALDPRQLQQIVRQTIVSALDVDAYNAEARAEAEDARRLHGMRQTVRDTLWSLVAGEEVSR